MVHQVRTIWTGPSSPVYSVMHFADGGGTPSQMAAAIAAFWASVDDNLNGAYSWTIDPEVKQFNVLTGALTAVHGITPSGGAGGSTAEYVDVIQGLLVWKTGSVLDGRALRGRTFLPGIDESRNAATGRPMSAFADAVAGAAATLVADANTSFVIWHRPKYSGKGDSRVLEREGGEAIVTSGTLKNRWSYLKTRRLS